MVCRCSRTSIEQRPLFSLWFCVPRFPAVCRCNRTSIRRRRAWRGAGLSASGFASHSFPWFADAPLRGPVPLAAAGARGSGRRYSRTTSCINHPPLAKICLECVLSHNQYSIRAGAMQGFCTSFPRWGPAFFVQKREGFDGGDRPCRGWRRRASRRRADM